MTETKASATLTDRIAAVLEGTPAPDDVATLIGDVEQELERLHREREKARQCSLDPLARNDVVSAAHEAANTLDFALARLRVALDRLRAKLEAAAAQAKEAERNAFRAEVGRERDALAAELRERYVAIASELAGLLARIKANNARAATAGLEAVENVVRGIPAHGRIGAETCAYLVDTVRLPSLAPLEAAYGRALWPLHQPLHVVNVVSPVMREHAAARGAEMRRIAEDVGARKADSGASRRGSQ